MSISFKLEVSDFDRVSEDILKPGSNSLEAWNQENRAWEGPPWVPKTEFSRKS